MSMPIHNVTHTILFYLIKYNFLFVKKKERRRETQAMEKRSEYDMWELIKALLFI